jgi:predicted Zn-dependent peptidase
MTQPIDYSSSVRSSFHDLSTYQKTILDNGVKIVTENIPYMRSVSLGIWVKCGSRLEDARFNGISHFIEHMLFKGTAKRSALQIAKEIDSVGGALNAFTSKELTSFYCRVMAEHLELATDLLNDIYLESSFPEDEIEREKDVICQEIRQQDDTPEELVHEILSMNLWKGDPLGQPILGFIPNILEIDRNSLTTFKRNNYKASQTLICAAGQVDHQKFVDLVAPKFSTLTDTLNNVCIEKPETAPGQVLEIKDLEQVHICVASEGPSQADKRRHAGYILNTILGGGMSSRLFQEVREKRGLAYNVYSFLSSYSDTGMFGIYSACEPDRFEELMDVLAEHTLGLSSSITDEDVRLAKNQLKGSIILAMESSEARMNRLAKGEIYFGKHIPVEKIIKDIDEVSTGELSDNASTMLHPGQFTIAVLGPAPSTADANKYFNAI